MSVADVASLLEHRDMVAGALELQGLKVTDRGMDLTGERPVAELVYEGSEDRFELRINWIEPR